MLRRTQVAFTACRGPCRRSTCPRASGSRAPPSSCAGGSTSSHVAGWSSTGPSGPTRRRSTPSTSDGSAPRSAWHPGPAPGSTRPTERPPTRPGGPGWQRSNRTTSCSTGSSSGAWPTCGCSRTTGRTPASATSRPACRGSRRCSAATRSSRAYEAIAFRPRPRRRDPRGPRRAARRSSMTRRTDAEPGKILHEVRTGEMARTGELPFATVLRQRRLRPRSG